MTFDNLGFEDGVAGSPGLADLWTISVTSSVEAYAGYDAGTYEEAWDSFEIDWSNAGWSLGLGATSAATYAATLAAALTVERFQLGWLDPDPNVPGVWLTELAATAAASYDTVPEAFEDFNEDWANATWATALGATTAASYDVGSPEAFEDFNEEWNNSTWTTALGATAAASYDGSVPEAFEDFEEVYPPVVFSVDPTANTLIAPSHGIPNGKLVRIHSTGKAPSNLNPALDFYVVNTATNTLQLAATVGGAALDIGDQGSGAHELWVDPYVNWNVVIPD